MNKTRMVLLMTALASWPVSAQTGSSSGIPHVQVELLSSVKTKKAKVGDKVKAKTASPLILSDGTAVPVASMISGQVREVEADAGGKSSVVISFDQVEVDGKKRPVPFVIRAAMLAGGSPGPAQDGNAISPSDVHHERPMAGRSQTVQDSAEVQSRAPSTSSTPDQKRSGPYMAAQTGTVIGLPGVMLQVDEDGARPSKFVSESPNLELKSGLQLMLVVPAAAK